MGSAALRGFLGFFSDSGATASLVFGFGPGFLRGCPDAVKPRGAGDPVAGVGVLAFAAPTPTPADARTEEFGVPCSGECGGELKLPGDEPSSSSMAVEGGDFPITTDHQRAAKLVLTDGVFADRSRNARCLLDAVCWAGLDAGCWLCASADSTPKSRGFAD